MSYVFAYYAFVSKNINICDRHYKIFLLSMGCTVTKLNLQSKAVMRLNC